MVTALLLLCSFALGITIGLQFAFKLKAIADDIIALAKKQSKKNSGVVRPGLSTSMPVAEPSDDSRKSAVVRPRPQPTDQDEKNMALSSVRNRVSRG